MFKEDDLFIDQYDREELELEETYKISELDAINVMRDNWVKSYWPDPHAFSSQNPGFLSSHRLSISKDPRGVDSFVYINKVNGYGECRELNHVAYGNAQIIRKKRGRDRFLKIHRWLSDQTYGLLYAPGVRFPRENFEFEKGDIDILKQYNMIRYRTGTQYSAMVITAPSVVKSVGKVEISGVYNYVEHASPILTVGDDTYAILLTTEGYRCIYLPPSLLDGVYWDVLEHHSLFDSTDYYKPAHFENFSLVMGQLKVRQTRNVDKCDEQERNSCTVIGEEFVPLTKHERLSLQTKAQSCFYPVGHDRGYSREEHEQGGGHWKQSPACATPIGEWEPPDGGKREVKAWNVANMGHCRCRGSEGLKGGGAVAVETGGYVFTYYHLPGSENQRAITINNMLDILGNSIHEHMRNDQDHPDQLNADNSVSHVVNVNSHLYPEQDSLMLENDNGFIRYKGKIVILDPFLLLRRLSSRTYLHSRRLLKSLKYKGTGDVTCIRRMLVALGYIPEGNGGWTLGDFIRVPRYLCARVFDIRAVCTCRYAMNVSSNLTCDVRSEDFRLSRVIENSTGIWFSYDRC